MSRGCCWGNSSHFETPVALLSHYRLEINKESKLQMKYYVLWIYTYGFLMQ